MYDGQYLFVGAAPFFTDEQDCEINLIFQQLSNNVIHHKMDVVVDDLRK